VGKNAQINYNVGYMTGLTKGKCDWGRPKISKQLIGTPKRDDLRIIPLILIPACSMRIELSKGAPFPD